MYTNGGVILRYIILFLLLIPLAFATSNHYYELHLYSINDTVSYTTLQVVPYSANIHLDPGNFIAEVISYDNEVLDVVTFPFSGEIYWDTWDYEGNIIDGGTIIENTFDDIIYVPYYDNAKEIIIYNEIFDEKLTINLGNFAKDKTVKKVEKKEVIQKSTEPVTKKSMLKLVVVIALISVVVIVILYLLLSFKKRNTTQ